jgi:hypothetical protein
LGDLYTTRADNLKGWPVVFLNMCESAEVTPALSTSFVDYFMAHKAIAVIGTETAAPPGFADEISRRTLRAFLSGKPLGSSLLDARKAGLAEGDYFGLAYTLFGAGSVRIEPPFVVSSGADLPSIAPYPKP